MESSAFSATAPSVPRAAARMDPTALYSLFDLQTWQHSGITKQCAMRWWQRDYRIILFVFVRIGCWCGCMVLFSFEWRIADTGPDLRCRKYYTFEFSFRVKLRSICWGSFAFAHLPTKSNWENFMCTISSRFAAIRSRCMQRILTTHTHTITFPALCSR